MRLVFLVLMILAANARSAPLAADESVVFYPTMGYRVEGGTNWELRIHGRIFEPKQRRVSSAILRKVLGLKKADMDETAKAIFADRSRAFLEDNERGKRVSIRLGDSDYELEKSKPNGHFSGILRLPEAGMNRFMQSGALSNRMIFFHVATPSHDSHANTNTFTGKVHLIDATGLSVISDIDDTIKVSQVANRKALVKNTFIKPFQPVPGMAEVYNNGRGNRRRSSITCRLARGSSTRRWRSLSAPADFRKERFI